MEYSEYQNLQFFSSISIIFLPGFYNPFPQEVFNRINKGNQGVRIQYETSITERGAYL
jgi:hypothetical protein